MPFKSLEQRRAWQAKRRFSAKVSDTQTLDAFLKSIGNCEDCKRVPAMLVTQDNIPLCARHWEALADSDVEWGTSMSDESRTALLEDVTSHRKALAGAQFTMKNLNGTWYVAAQTVARALKRNPKPVSRYFLIPVA